MPTTGKYALVQIGSVYLTSTGMSGGKPCKTEITGLEKLATGKTIQITNAMSGKPYMQVMDQILGVLIGIKLFDVSETVYDSIIAVITAAINGSTTISLSITNSPFGDFTLTVVPDEKTVEHAFKFSGDIAKEPIFGFQTYS